MGRELKRVPLDFKWKIHALWCGYINPHKIHVCESCEGSGFSTEYLKLREEWYCFNSENWTPNPYREDCIYNANAWSNNLTNADVKALLKADRLWSFTRMPITDEQKEIVKKRIDDGESSWLPFGNGYIPTPDEVNEWNLKTLGHDSINAWVCIKARLKKEKKPYKCSSCNGTGENWQSIIAKRLYYKWKEYDPPIGDGFQLWNTTTEGHPMTPVFETLEALCQYCEDEKVSLFGRETATKEEWFKMLNTNNVYYQDGNKIFI